MGRLDELERLMRRLESLNSEFTSIVSSIRHELSSVSDDSDVTFGITHWLRPEQLKRCIASIRRHYPTACVDHESTGGNLSAGRNRLVSRCKTKYFFLIEEDMVVIGDPLSDLKRVIEFDKSIIGCAGGVIEANRTLIVAGVYREREAHIDLCNAIDVFDANGVKYLRCDYTLNVGLFRTDALRMRRWDERLSLAEHHQFYWKHRGVMAACKWMVRHTRARPDGYVRWRRRWRQYNRRCIRLMNNKRVVSAEPSIAYDLLSGDCKSVAKANQLRETMATLRDNIQHGSKTR